VGLLAWLGFKQGDAYPNLDALLRELRKALPDDESVVLRYIAIVIVLLGKVATSDGRFTEKEEQTLRSLLAHVERLSPTSVEAVCEALRGKIPELSDDELSLCYRELKALCDGRERLEVMRLLVGLATADGRISAAESAELTMIAEELGVSLSDVEAVTNEVEQADAKRESEGEGGAQPS
jgi:DnaJ like chaperone protein